MDTKTGILRFVKWTILVVGFWATTAIGLITGWSLDQSLIPPFGGGWKCYAACLGITWLFVAFGFASVLMQYRGWRSVLTRSARTPN